MVRPAIRMNTPITAMIFKGQVWQAEGDLRGEVFQCQSGMLWITQKGDLNDYIVRAGERFWVTRPGTVLVEAVHDASFTCTRGTPPRQEPVYAHLGCD